MRTAKPIILELRSRLQAAGFPVFIGKTVDPNQDELPLVSVHYGADGEQSIRTDRQAIRELQLVVEYWQHATSLDPALDLIDKADEILDALIQSRSVNKPDTVGGHATGIWHERTLIFNHEEHSDTGFAQVVVRVRY